jgi:glycosyltransferase involved in cell wall biosynthesis
MSCAPTVTVLMSVYNGQTYLREAIKSILNQTFTDFEFLIINDGSSDASRSIICSYDDPRIRLIDNPANLGLTKSLNRGLRLAKGRYVARQDADDVSEPQRLTQQVNFMEANQHLALLGTWYRGIDAEGNFAYKVRLPSDQIELQWALLFYCPFVHSSVMLNKEFFLHDIGLYNEEYLYAQDHELWFRTSRQHIITNFHEYLVRYRINPHSMTATYGELVNEGVWLTTAAVGSLLEWVEDNQVANEARFKKMFELLYGNEVRLNLAEVEHVTATIWQLQRAFEKAYQLNPSEAQRHKKKLCSWMSQRYVRVALGYLERCWHSEAQQLYFRGLLLRPLTFFSIKSVWLLYNVLLIQPMRRFLSHIRKK